MSEWETYLLFRDRIAPVLDERIHPLAWLDAQVFAGLVRVLSEGASCLLYEFKPYPSGAQEIHAVVAVGDAEVIAGPLRKQFEQIGREAGCLFAGVASRPGWARRLKAEDYHVYQVTVRKEL